MRERLPERRFNITRKVDTHDKSKRLTVTFGFDIMTLDVKEIFCADFKAGTDQHAIITDACILISRLLQHGDTPEALQKSLGEPPSLLGTLVAAAAAEQEYQKGLNGVLRTPLPGVGELIVSSGVLVQKPDQEPA